MDTATELLENRADRGNNRLRNFFSQHRKFICVFQAGMILAAFAELLQCESYYIPYLLVVAASVACLTSNSKTGITCTRSECILSTVFAFAFALMVTYANYRIWEKGGILQLILNLVIWIGAFFAFENIMIWLCSHHKELLWKSGTSFRKPLTVFLITFGLILAIDLIVLYFSRYPGVMNHDSRSQVRQLLTGVYSNHHPVWHTWTIKLFMNLGMSLFHDINAAVATYSVFSITLMAATFAFSTATLAELKLPRWIIVIVIAFYALMPYHILFSMSMFKDTVFAACVLQFITFFCRCKCGMSLRPFNTIGFVVSAIGICLFRSNGLFAFAFSTLCFVALWRFKDRKTLFIMLAVCLCCVILKHPVLDALNITQPDIAETLSVPEQQIARDILEDDDFTEEQLELLGNVIDVEAVPEAYKPYISNPIKELVREKDNQAYLKDHIFQFLKLYVTRLLKHPFVYLKGWIDQTKGYWNSGYEYYRWNLDICENDLGIYQTVRSGLVDTIVRTYADAFEENPVLVTFLCIGLYDWILLMALFISIIRRDKIGIMVAAPLIMIIVSLLIATPVYSEFRYAYAIMCGLPVVLAIALRPDALEGNK